MRVITTLDDLLRLPRDRSVNGLGARARIRLDIPGFTRHAQLVAQESLNALQSRCGCVSGGIVTLVALVIGSIVITRTHTTFFATLRDAALWLVIAFVAGLIAKLGTLLFTQWQFTFRCRAHHRRLINEEQDVHVHAMGR